MKDIWTLAFAVVLSMLIILAIRMCEVPYHYHFMVPSLISVANASEDLSSLYLAYVTEIVDADTLDVVVPAWPRVVVKARIRIAGVDTPETRGAKCPQEKALALKARVKLQEWLPKNGAILLHIVKPREKYGRVLAKVFSGDGVDIAKRLIVEGLARAYDGKGKRPGWCDEKKEKPGVDGPKTPV